VKGHQRSIQIHQEHLLTSCMSSDGFPARIGCVCRASCVELQHGGEPSDSLLCQRSPLSVRIIWNWWTCFRTQLLCKVFDARSEGDLALRSSLLISLTDRMRGEQLSSTPCLSHVFAASQESEVIGRAINSLREGGRAAKRIDCRESTFMREIRTSRCFVKPD
jgi:hypothetical protein